MKSFALIAFFLLAFLAPAYAAANNIVGTILEVEGQASLTPPGGQPAGAVVTMTVSPGDVITTGAGARVYVQLIDNTELTLGENGQMTVDDYNFNVNIPSENRATYSVLRGAFLYVSGLIAKRPDPQVRVNIPVGSIGIRGTKFWGGNVGNTYDIIVGDGEIEVDTGGGKVRVKKGQGTSVKARGTAPGPVKSWSPDKIAQAVATVALKNPAAVGERMKQNMERNEMLRNMHQEKIIEEKILKEESVKPQAPLNAETTERARERLRRLQEEKARRMSGLPATPEAPVATIRREGQNVVRAVTRSEPAKTTVETTVDSTRAVTNDAKRTVDSVTETTTTVIEKADGTVQTTVEKVTESVDKPVTNTTGIVKDTTGKVLKTLKKD